MKRITLTQWFFLVLYLAVLIACAGVIFDDENIGEGLTMYAISSTSAIAVAAGIWALYRKLGIWRSIAANIDE